MYATKRIEPGSTKPGASGWRARLERVVLLALIAVVTLNIWTGSPLIALWLGAQVQGSGRLTMLVVAVVVVVTGILSLVLVRLLNSLTYAYDERIGRPRRRREASWQRSRDVERLELQRSRHAPEARVTALDFVLVSSVVVPIVAFEVWFFLYASDPIPKWAF